MVRPFALVCPKCAAANRPGATVIEIDPDQAHAYCGGCGFYGRLVRFQPKGRADS
jgi:hypothetical protein